MRALARLGLATVAMAAVSIAGYATGARSATAPVLGPGLVTIEVRIHHSRFLIDKNVHVRPGTQVRFVVINDDPINHELVVGDAAVHQRHEQGTEASHPPIPGEVSVGALDNGLTTYRFDTPGTFEYVCHLPGHAAYGMKGVFTVG
jgi:plastocyanin